MCVRPPHDRLSKEEPLSLLAWVLEDYDARDAVGGFPELFGRGRIVCQLPHFYYYSLLVHN